jgi:hypothetical protein
MTVVDGAMPQALSIRRFIENASDAPSGQDGKLRGFVSEKTAHLEKTARVFSMGM